MKKPKIIQWYEPVYKVTIGFYDGFSEEEYIYEMKREFNTDVKREGKSGGWAITNSTNENQMVFTMWVEFSDSLVFRVATLAHEALHVAQQIFKNRGVTVVDDEALAYYQHMILQKTLSDAKWFK